MASRPAGRKRKSASSAQPVRRTAVSRSTFSLLVLIVALPALAVLALYAWRFARSVHPSTAGPVSSAAMVERATGPNRRQPFHPLRPQSMAAGHPRIVIILDDVGFDEAAVTEAAGIQGALNFAVLPNAPHSAEAARYLHERGFEILCHLPMEPDDGRNSPGSGAVLSSMSDAEIRAATISSFRAIPDAQGMNNHMGSRATADPRVMNDVLSVLPRGVYFIDSRTTAETVGEKTARRLSIPTASRDVFLDDTRSEASVRKQLALLSTLATERGQAVGIGHMYPVTIAVLKEELPKLRQRGFRFVRASEVVD